MHFLYPIGFLALTSLIIPIIIHLWRVTKGKTLKIGNISLLGESAASNAKSLQIREWLLFLLRCLIFILISLIITSPFFTGEENTKNAKGWILLDKNNWSKIYKAQKNTIDSLLKAGFELHDFAYSFKQFNLEDTVTARNNAAVNKSYNYSSLLKAVNQQLPNKYPVWVFADRFEKHFDNDLPKLHINVNWKNVMQRDSSYQIALLNKTFEASTNQNALTYQLKKEGKIPALKVLLQPSAAEDARYLKAALTAIATYFNHKMVFVNANSKADVIFWLSDKPVDDQTSSSLKENGIMFKYGSGKVNEQLSFLLIDGNTSPIKSFKNTVSTGPHDEVWWKDGFGNNILTLNKTSNKKVFTFYSRLNQQWADLVWQEAFVKALIPILYHDKPTSFGFEANGNQPIITSEPVGIFEETNNKINITAPNQSLNQWIWLFAVLVLLTERILTYRNKNLLKTA